MTETKWAVIRIVNDGNGNCNGKNGLSRMMIVMRSDECWNNGTMERWKDGKME